MERRPRRSQWPAVNKGCPWHPRLLAPSFRHRPPRQPQYQRSRLRPKPLYPRPAGTNAKCLLPNQPALSKASLVQRPKGSSTTLVQEKPPRVGVKSNKINKLKCLIYIIPEGKTAPKTICTSEARKPFLGMFFPGGIILREINFYLS